MLYEIKLRIKTPVVGNTWDHARRMFIFPREEGAWCLDITTKHIWLGLLENAVESLGLSVDVDSIRWPRTLMLPTLHLLEIHSSPERKQRPVKHESIPRNVILTIPLMIRHTDGEKILNYPTHDKLQAIFKFIGTYEGISPFGSSTGYGLFDVKSIHTMGRTIIDACEPSQENPEGVHVHDQEHGRG
jgi:hypothetical protein